MFRKRQPPPVRRGGLTSTRPSTRLLQYTKPGSALEPWLETTDLHIQLASAGVTVATGSVDQNVEQTPDVPEGAQIQANPKRVLKQGGSTMGSDSWALRETSNNGRLAKDLMGSKLSSGNSGRISSKRVLSALSTDKSVSKEATGDTHGIAPNKPKVPSRYVGSGPSQKKRVLAAEDRPQSAKTRETGHAASFVSRRPAVTTSAVPAVEAASADVAPKEVAEQQRERGGFKIGSAQDFYTTAGGAGGSGGDEGHQGDATSASWQPSSFVAAIAPPLRDVEDGAETLGPPHTPGTLCR